jgi:hypothetical protein
MCGGFGGSPPDSPLACDLRLRAANSSVLSCPLARYFKLSFQTKQELIEKGVCGDDVPECSESPNRGTCQKVIDGVEQFVSCGCCQRKPAAFPPLPGSAELDSNQWLNVSPKTTFVLDAGYGAEAPANCEQPFTEYKHASQFSPYEPMARQVQDGADVANPAYKNGRYELDPYAFPVGVYTDSSDYSFTAEYSKIPASNRIPLSGIGIKTTSEDATCGSDFNAESVRTPESVGWSQCAPLGTLQSVAPLDVAKFSLITPQEIMQVQVGEIVVPENPETGFAYQVGGERLITTGTSETYPFGRIANPGDRTNDQITKPVLGWANKLFYGYSVKDWYLDNLPNNVYSDGNETQCVWGAVTEYAEDDTTVPLALRYPWWTRTVVGAFTLWLEAGGTGLDFSDKWVNTNPTVFFSQSGSGGDVSLNEYTDLSNPCPAEMPKDKTPVRPSRFSTMWTSQFCECARGDCNRDGAQGILTPKQISIESLSSDRPMRAAETENGCNAGANSAKWITNKVWGCEAEEVLYGCRIHITQTDVTTSIDGGTTGRNDANQCLQPLSNFDFDISVFNSNPSTTESECWELDTSVPNCFYFDEDMAKPMAPAFFSKTEWEEFGDMDCANTFGSFRCATNSPRTTIVPGVGRQGYAARAKRAKGAKIEPQRRTRDLLRVCERSTRAHQQPPSLALASLACASLAPPLTPPLLHADTRRSACGLSLTPWRRLANASSRPRHRATATPPIRAPRCSRPLLWVLSARAISQCPMTAQRRSYALRGSPNSSIPPYPAQASSPPTLSPT